MYTLFCAHLVDGCIKRWFLSIRPSVRLTRQLKIRADPKINISFRFQCAILLQRVVVRGPDHMGRISCFLARATNYELHLKSLARGCQLSPIAGLSCNESWAWTVDYRIRRYSVHAPPMS